MELQNTAPSSAYTGWRSLVARYQQPDLQKSIWQIVNSYGGLLLCWLLMLFSFQVGYWLTLLLAIPAAGFVVRIFIIQHDCGHGSFFKLRRANDSTGILCSIFTLIPYKCWRKSHAVHHAHHAELEERGTGDVWTMTVNEFRQAGVWRRLLYRFFRHPLFLFGIAPLGNFLILSRFPIGVPSSWNNGERASVWWTNLMIAGWAAAASAVIGFEKVLLIQLPVIMIAATVGTWLFYVQHQYERTYWEHSPDWDYTLAAMQGSSYYKLPRLMQWFTGNIGFHHIHHLSPRIPNYNLESCHQQNPTLQRVVQLTMLSSLKTVWLTLWDEEQERLVTFREAFQHRPVLVKVAQRSAQI